MDLFGDDDDEIAQELDPVLQSAFVQLLRQKHSLSFEQSGSPATPSVAGIATAIGNGANSSSASSGRRIVYRKRLAVLRGCCGSEALVHPGVQQLLTQLRSVGYEDVQELVLGEEHSGSAQRLAVVQRNCFDVAVALGEPFSGCKSAAHSSEAQRQLLQCAWDCLRAGAPLVYACSKTAPDLTAHPWRQLWACESVCDGVQLLRKRGAMCNEGGATYWTRDGLRAETVPSSSSIRKVLSLAQSTRLPTELDLLDAISVPLLSVEVSTGKFAPKTISRAVQILREHGVCIIPGLFNREEVMKWGSCARADMRQCVRKLRVNKGLDLLRPTVNDPRIENFYELSMREALRCDLRNGKEMTAKARQTYGNSNNNYGKQVSRVDGGVDNSMEPQKDLRFHPSILEILTEAMNIPCEFDSSTISMDRQSRNMSLATYPEFAKGNWGRYNFEQPGPLVIPKPVIGQLGTVMSLPGCADQTIHADTAHTFVHTHLPPHYVNLFAPAIPRYSVDIDAVNAETSSYSENVENAAIFDGAEPDRAYQLFPEGQTAFVVGSHRLATSAFIMTEEGGQEELERRLVRPQLDVGDALLFDCRILHFGLANQAPIHSLPRIQPSGLVTSPKSGETERDLEWKEESWRPLLYVNYHHDWFHDPKNWNDKEKLFDVSE